MLRTIGRTLAATAIAATLGIGIAPAAAQAGPAETIPVVQRAAPLIAEPRLVDVDVNEHANFDRIILRFRGGTPELDARYVRRVRLDNGRNVRLPGRAILLLQAEPARARDIERGLQDVDLDQVLAFRLVGDRRGVVRLAVALRERAAIRVVELPNRLVIDVDNRDRDRDRDLDRR